MTTEPTEMTPDQDALVRLVASCDDLPTLDQIDEMVALLGRMPANAVDTDFSDQLLELRKSMTDGRAA